MQVEDIHNLIETYSESGDIQDDAKRKFEMHLTAVERFEERKDASKVAKHMESFQLLLDQQLQAGKMSTLAYEDLSAETTDMIYQWK
ncbi:FIMAH domain-containing protein [Oceanobacillus kimchii]|uniref:FIMAH domain-containing protein n=1 Tax=Oceanobacillus kimchii TaxID=746691 RepID=UPI0035CD32D7